VLRIPSLQYTLLLAFAIGRAQPAPELRLGDGVKPQRYALDLTVLPDADTFSGTVDIDVDVRRPAALIWVNAAGLGIREAALSAGGVAMPARVVPGNSDFLGFQFDRPVPPGAARLHIRYEGKFSLKSSDGLYKVKENGGWYVFSNFEPTDARRAFPCFDEPGFKTPWRITLHTSKDYLAFSNAPLASRKTEPGGLHAFAFAETKPLPTYLVAFTVGRFDVVDAGKAGKNQIPVRIIAPRGKRAQAKYAAQTTPQILALLENYFGIPYPFEKLDSLAAPLFPGAMENPGLVTYAQPLILSAPEKDTISRQREFASTCAHELAHQWFGDLVTMAWWNDLWLNEAFAEWLMPKIIDQWKPEWHAEISEMAARSGAMDEDSLPSARAIRQPIASKHDIADAFDSITYQKGAAVIKMFESWIGPETFQRGVQLYLRRHAWGNAAAGDFLAALSSAAGRDVAPAFSTFLDQPGVPLVSVELDCGRGFPRLLVAQKRLLPLGFPHTQQQTWQIPACIEYGYPSGESRQCTLLAGPRAELRLPAAPGCPSWVLPNEGGIGYYRTLYRGGLLDRLLSDGGRHLTVPERIAVLDDVAALVKSGDVPMTQALGLVPRFSTDPDRHVVSSTVSIAADLDYYDLVPDRLRPHYARFIRAMFGQRARDLGWAPKPGEDEETRLLRRRLVPFAAEDGEDRTLIEEAGRLARRWLKDRRAVDPEMVEGVLRVAAQNGGRRLFEQFYQAAKRAQERRERRRLLAAMGSFRDPAIVRSALALLLNDAFDPRESISLLWAPMANHETRALPYEFVKQNFDALMAKLPRDGGAAAGLPMVATAFCDAEHQAEAREFFKERMEKITGGPRNLEQAIEQIGACIAIRSSQQAAVAEFLEKY
jgi:alanyl aminopeptidase